MRRVLSERKHMIANSWKSLLPLPAETMLWAWEEVGRQSPVEPWCMRIGRGESVAREVKESAPNAWHAIFCGTLKQFQLYTDVSPATVLLSLVLSNCIWSCPLLLIFVLYFCLAFFKSCLPTCASRDVSSFFGLFLFGGLSLAATLQLQDCLLILSFSPWLSRACVSLQAQGDIWG